MACRRPRPPQGGTHRRRPSPAARHSLKQRRVARLRARRRPKLEIWRAGGRGGVKEHVPPLPSPRTNLGEAVVPAAQPLGVALVPQPSVQSADPPLRQPPERRHVGARHCGAQREHSRSLEEREPAEAVCNVSEDQVAQAVGKREDGEAGAPRDE
eukprot:scaffold16470_cov120-Isochrysis_galbana.AAC.3